MPETLSPISEREDAQFSKVRARESALLQFNDLLATEPGRISHWLEGLRRGIVQNLTEQIAPGDFPNLFGTAIQRDMVARYKVNVADWRTFTKVGSLPNFNTHELYKVYGQDNELPEVLPGAPYPITPSGEGNYDRRVHKYGRRFDILWESIINDAMGAFSDIAARFSDAVIRTQARHVTEAYCSATGPNANLFGATITDVDGQAVTNVGVLPLTIANLQTTLQLMSAQTDPNGERISVRAKHIVVPGSLEFTARAILTSALQQQTGSAVPVPVANIVPQLGLVLHVDPYLETVDVSGTGDSTWYLFAEPGEAAAVGMDYLAGNVGPDMRIRSSGSGGNPLEGDFENDAIAYRVRDVHGATVYDPRYCYAQVAP